MIKVAINSRWIRHFKHIEHVILLGDTAEDIAQSMRLANFTRYEFASTCKMRCIRAWNLHASTAAFAMFAIPACASFDKYANYEERGRDFKANCKCVIMIVLKFC